MRIATYNVEWFNALFDAQGQLQADESWSARYNVTRAAQLEALAIVFTALDADAILVVEAPDDSPARPACLQLERFAAWAGLRARRAVMGFANDTQQELVLLYDPDVLQPRHDPQGAAPFAGQSGGDPGQIRFDQAVRLDPGLDGRQDLVRFSKPPLELALHPLGAPPLRLIGVHVKSKAPHGAQDPAQARRVALQNRRKQLGECLWLRARIDQHLDRGEDLLVLGDFNDGPGLDEHEALFGRSGLDVVLGQDRDPCHRLHDPHARLRGLLGQGGAAMPASARFYRDDRRQFFSAMLDFILISPGLLARRPRWRIWHPFDDPALYRIPELRDALLTASDHFPVTLDLPAPR